MMMTHRWKSLPVLALLCASALGCAVSHTAYELQATPRPDGRIDLAWNAQEDSTPEHVAYEVQHRGENDEWTSVGMFQAPWANRVTWSIQASTLDARSLSLFG